MFYGLFTSDVDHDRRRCVADWLSTAAGLTWLYLGYSFIVVYLGGLLQFPEWMGKYRPLAVPHYHGSN